MKQQMEPYLIGKGIQTNRNFPCPVCGHGHRTPCASFDPATNRVKCFSCDWNGDLIDLIGEEYHLTSNAEKLEKTAEVLGFAAVPKPRGKACEPTPRTPQTTVNRQNDKENRMTRTDTNKAPEPPHRNGANPDNIHSQQSPQSGDKQGEKTLSPPHIATCDLTEEARKYLGKRLIDADAAGIRSTADGRGIVIPYPQSDYYVTRSLHEKRYCYPKNTPRPLFRESDLYNSENRPVFIVEGQIDALSIARLGYPAVALGGCGPRILVEQLKQHPSKNILVLALDNDDPGRAMAESMANQLKEIGQSFLRAELYGEWKDANECLVNDADHLAAELVVTSDNAADIHEFRLAEADAEYAKNSICARINDFITELRESKHRKPFPTGFVRLDEVLGGGLQPGLFVIGAMSSLGKTTFALQMADHISANGQDVLFFSLEMSTEEIMAKGLSRESFLAARDAKLPWGYALSTQDILQYDIRNEKSADLLQKAAERYKERTAHHFIIEGLGDFGVADIKKAVQTHYQKTGRYPIVFVDYLQIISASEMFRSDKQQVDRAVCELKRLSRDCRTPVVVISSLNRSGYNEGVTMQSFKESGTIEYSADVLLGLELKNVGDKEFDMEAARKEQPRKVVLKVLKNRNGETGSKIELNYQTRCNLFAEAKRSEE